MSNTPETDKNVSVGLENADRECVPVDFSCKLERERDEAREERDTLQAMRKEVVAANKGAKINAHVSNSLAVKLNRAERERDEARNQRDILRLDAQKEAEHHDRMVGELEKVYKERDELRNQLNALREHRS